MTRVFLASDLAIPIATKLGMAQRSLAEMISNEGAEFRPVSVENLHVTYKFFGEVADERVGLIREILTELVKPLFPFEVGVQQVGGFPTLADATVIWADLDERSREVMGLLQKTIEKEVGKFGFEPEERAFRPHITLGRVRSSLGVNLSQQSDHFSGIAFGKSFIKDIALFESRLTKDGPVYSVLDRFELGSV